MNKILVDTNTILRLLLNDIPSQYLKVKQIFDTARNGDILIFIPESVIFEVYFTLKSYYEYPKSDLLNIIRSLVLTDYIKIENKILFLEALKIYKNTNLQFVDCFLVVKSKSLDFDLFTFDEKLKKYAKSI